MFVRGPLPLALPARDRGGRVRQRESAAAVGGCGGPGRERVRRRGAEAELSRAVAFRPLPPARPGCRRGWRVRRARRAAEVGGLAGRGESEGGGGAEAQPPSNSSVDNEVLILLFVTIEPIRTVWNSMKVTMLYSVNTSRS